MSAESRPHQPWPIDGERVASFCVFVAVLYMAYLTLRPVLLVVVLAAALASMSFGIFEWTARRLRGRRRVAAILVVLTLLLVLVGTFGAVAAIVIGRLVSEAATLAANGGNALDAVASRLGPLGDVVRRVAAELQPQITGAIPTLARRAAHYLGALGSAAGHIGLWIFLLAVTLYYFYLNGVAWRDRLVQLLPLPADDVRLFFSRFHQVSVAVLVGNLGTALAQGAVATVGFWLIGAPAPLVFGFLTTIAALVPMVGSWLVWAPLAVWLGVTRSPGRGIILGVYGLLIVSTIDNIVRPLLTQRGLRENPLLIFLAVFGGLWSFGIAGLFIGPVVMALTITVVHLYAHKRGLE